MFRLFFLFFPLRSGCVFKNLQKQNSDAHYEEMFENGNFRRRRRMKRTYNRTSAAHISRLYESPYNPNYSTTARMYANPSYRYSYPDPAWVIFTFNRVMWNQHIFKKMTLTEKNKIITPFHLKML